MDLAASAKFSAVLREGRCEPRLPKDDPGQMECVEGVGQFPAPDPGRTEELEGSSGSATLGEVSSLEQHLARIDARGVQGRHIGRGHHPRQARLRELQGTRPPGDRCHRQGHRLNHEAGVEQACQLTHGHSVAHGDRLDTHQRHPLGGLQHRTLQHDAPKRVGPVEHEQWDAMFGAGLHGLGECAHVGVGPRTHILDVKDHEIDAFGQGGIGGDTRAAADHPGDIGQHGARGLKGFAVQAEEREPQHRIPLKPHLVTRLRITPDPMLRTIECHQLEVLPLAQLQGQ